MPARCRRPTCRHTSRRMQGIDERVVGPWCHFDQLLRQERRLPRRQPESHDTRNPHADLGRHAEQQGLVLHLALERGEGTGQVGRAEPGRPVGPVEEVGVAVLRRPHLDVGPLPAGIEHVVRRPGTSLAGPLHPLGLDADPLEGPRTAPPVTAPGSALRRPAARASRSCCRRRRPAAGRRPERRRRGRANPTRITTPVQAVRRQRRVIHGAAKVTAAVAAARYPALGNAPVTSPSADANSRSTWPTSPCPIAASRATTQATASPPTNPSCAASRNRRRASSPPSTTSGTNAASIWPTASRASSSLVGSRAACRAISASRPPTVERPHTARTSPTRSTASPTSSRRTSPGEKRRRAGGPVKAGGAGVEAGAGACGDGVPVKPRPTPRAARPHRGPCPGFK